MVGALVVAWATFVPSFLWIFLGAPSVERLRGNERLSGALTAITASVVGVIANLAVVFATSVLFDEVHVRTPFGHDVAVPVLGSADLLAIARRGRVVRRDPPLPRQRRVGDRGRPAGLVAGLVDTTSRRHRLSRRRRRCSRGGLRHSPPVGYARTVTDRDVLEGLTAQGAARPRDEARVATAGRRVPVAPAQHDPGGPGRRQATRTAARSTSCVRSRC